MLVLGWNYLHLALPRDFVVSVRLVSGILGLVEIKRIESSELLISGRY
jgi:hypothetical protein